MLLPWGAGATVSPSSPSRAFSQRRARGTAADPRGRRSWTALGATPVAALASVKRRSRVSQRQRWDQLNHAAELGDVARTKEIFWEMQSWLPESEQRLAYNTVLKACANAADLVAAEEWYEVLPAKGLVPNKETYGKLSEAVAYDFSLKRAVIEVDRDADRRWSFATDKMKLAEDKDEVAPNSAPLEEVYLFANDGENHTNNVKQLENMKKALEDSSAPADAAKLKKMLDGFKIPAAGEDFTVKLPRKLIDDLKATAGGIAAQKEGKSDSELDEMWWKQAGELVAGYYKQREEVEKDVEGLKKFFRSQKDMPGKTKADIVKQIWKELPKHMDTPVAPLDEEMLVDLAKEPAVIEGEFKHSWGTAEKLYKSEAIDSFGNRYLLGVFENKADAEKAFDARNKEYEQAGKDVKENLKNWAKQQEAELAEEQDSVDRIRKALEEARR